MKVLEAYCKAKGYQGGNIFMVLEECSNYYPVVYVKNSVYFQLGLLDGMMPSNGYNLASYNIPEKILENKEGTIEYIIGLSKGLDIAWDETKDHIGPDIEYFDTK